MNNLKIYIKSILIPVIVGGIIGLIINPFINYGSLRNFVFYNLANFVCFNGNFIWNFKKQKISRLENFNSILRATWNKCFMVNLLLFIKMETIFIYMDTSFRCYSNLHDCVILQKK